MSALAAALAATTALACWRAPDPHRRLTRAGLRPLPPSRRPTRHPPETAIPEALVLDLIAAVLESGAPPTTALAHVADALRATNAPPTLPAVLDEEARRLTHPPSPSPGPAHAHALGTSPPADDPPPPTWDALSAPLALAAATGIAPAEPMRRAAGEHRRRNTTARTAALRRLEILLVLPTGLCLLPAFVLLGIAPIVIDLFLTR